jgi:hypothetical protein
MPRNKTLRVVVGVVLSFAGLAGMIILLSAMNIIGFAMAKLMLVALFGMYVGFGILIAIYRLLDKLD